MSTINNSNPGNSIPSPSATRLLYIVLALFTVLIIGLSVWLISMKSNLNALQTEKEIQKVELQREVDSLLTVHNQVKQEYSALAESVDAQLMEKDSIIQANANEIKRLLDTEWEYYKIKKKLTQLQTISQVYVRQMDSMYTVNRELTEENERIKEEYHIEIKRNRQLNKVKEELADKVETAAVLRAFNIEATGIRKRGSSKEIETDKINRVERIKVSFTIAQNAIVVPGTKTLYLRISQPDGKVLIKGRGDEYSFMYKGEKLQYSIVSTINYQNIDETMSVYWDRRDSQELQKGIYNVDIYEGDHLIGNTAFTLR
ncbi:MAG: hypothetical protein LBM67_05945 [Lentimicrobiaceae bacterium]|jgi:Tfp pilus assembly protein PilO|nr:hypothetical protein [Lentimicrobiaceae bacterium]